jgi:hypothetical protein
MKQLTPGELIKSMHDEVVSAINGSSELLFRADAQSSSLDNSSQLKFSYVLMPLSNRGIEVPEFLDFVKSVNFLGTLLSNPSNILITSRTEGAPVTISMDLTKVRFLKLYRSQQEQ